ncbi:lipolytic protein G-D-S-L family [Chthoniobacter flavus Ellin428]|uniref:Lipolytic protein G-D-S-L family n=1 Tax=Chthoniobacter flavus Ellin428 TaxID=497964 RepID=B4D940_9BACT|nr:GDSL-type esterase/lipase family protein [Chthoniobacter flavus]EDY17085.1 lipolytic protein G-D-S-L family [Chthoniobacter flavus Ellin428]TCO86149.1 lysophospholipase L1-like esterase [Chthoniobacter flavus]
MPPRLRLPAIAALLALPLLSVPPCAQAAPPPKAEVVASLAAPTMQRDAQGTVTLTGATPGAVIRYSIDGSDPGPKTGPYLAPIVLPAGGVVKARAFSEDRKQMSELVETKFEATPGATAQPSTLVPCTQDRDWPIYDWAVRHAAVTKIATEKKASLVFIGDSITQMFGGEPHDRPQPGKDVWEQFYGKRNAANLGFGYDFVENTLWRLRHGELDGAAAKVVVILIGTNNVSRNTPEEIAAGVRAICAEVHERQPAAKTVLMAVFPRGPKPDAPRAKIDAINKLIADLDGKNGIIFFDIGAKFLEPDGSITRETMGDFLHPTAKGYGIWARELEPLLTKLLGEAKP